MGSSGGGGLGSLLSSVVPLIGGATTNNMNFDSLLNMLPLLGMMGVKTDTISTIKEVLHAVVDVGKFTLFFVKTCKRRSTEIVIGMTIIWLLTTILTE